MKPSAAFRTRSPVAGNGLISILLEEQLNLKGWPISTKCNCSADKG
jgi:hypothetical protein